MHLVAEVRSGPPPGPPPQPPARFSFRTRVFLTYAAVALLLVFAAFTWGSFYVNALQRRTKDDALELATSQAVEMSRKVGEVLNRMPTPDLDRPEVREDLRPIIDLTLRLNRDVVVAAVFDKQGNRVIEHGQPGEQELRIAPRGAGPGQFTADLTELNNGTPLKFDLNVRAPDLGGESTREIRRAFTRNGQNAGEIRLRIARNPAFGRIQEASRLISRALAVGCLMLLGTLLAVFWVLWRAFARHLELVQHNERLDRMAYVGTLASGLAHEIRNPLSSMNVNLEVIREELAETPGDAATRSHDLATRVQKEVALLAGTLTSFLEFALPGKEGHTTFSLRGLVDELMELHAEQMRQAGVSFDVATVPSAAETSVTADRRLLHQAIRNVLINAIQILAAGVKKQIKVRVEAVAGSRLRVVVTDSGPGVPPENLPRLFDVFFSTRKGGSGLGLAIARKICEEHGGGISAANNEGSLGATFTLEFPQSQPRTER